MTNTQPVSIDTQSVSELAERVAHGCGIVTDGPKALILRRLRHWTLAGVLPVEGDARSGIGRHRQYLLETVYLAATLNRLADTGLPLGILKSASSGIQELASGRRDTKRYRPSKLWREAIDGGENVYAHFHIHVPARIDPNEGGIVAVMFFTDADLKKTIDLPGFGSEPSTFLNLTAVFSRIKRI